MRKGHFYPVFKDFNPTGRKGAQIADMIRGSWRGGTLRKGMALPSVRDLASSLGVSKSTVGEAYHELSDEGVLAVRDRTKAVVARDYTAPRKGGSGRTNPGEEPGTRPDRKAPATSRRSRLALTPGQHLWKVANAPLAPWISPMSRTPDRHWQSIVARVVRMTWKNPGHCPPAGLPELREVLSEGLRICRGMECGPERIFVTSGTMQSLSIASQVLFDPGDKVGVEAPGSRDLFNVLRWNGCDLSGLPVDPEGAAVPGDDSGLRGILVTPANQFPSGIRMSLRRRHEILDWSERNGAWVIEDGFDEEFSGSVRLPSISSLAAGGNVIYLRTFSHIFFPGARMGVMIVPKELVPVFSGAKQRTDRFTSPAMQAALNLYFRSGGYYAYSTRASRRYDRNRRLLVRLCEERLAPWGRVTSNASGSHVAFSLKEGIRDREDAEAAARRGVSTVPLSIYETLGCEPLNGLALGFGGFSPEEIESAVATISDVLRKLQPKPGQDRSRFPGLGGRPGS